MTDRQRELIRAYLPSPRDPELGDDEYYVKDTAGRIHRVYIRNIYPRGDRNTYDCFEVNTDRRIDAGYGSEWVGFYKRNMYDNKQDCRDDAHYMCDDWEHLRTIQENE